MVCQTTPATGIRVIMPSRTIFLLGCAAQALRSRRRLRRARCGRRTGATAPRHRRSAATSRLAAVRAVVPASERAVRVLPSDVLAAPPARPSSSPRSRRPRAARHAGARRSRASRSPSRSRPVAVAAPAARLRVPPRPAWPFAAGTGPADRCRVFDGPGHLDIGTGPACGGAVSARGRAASPFGGRAADGSRRRPRRPRRRRSSRLLG